MSFPSYDKAYTKNANTSNENADGEKVLPIKIPIILKRKIYTMKVDPQE